MVSHEDGPYPAQLKHAPYYVALEDGPKEEVEDATRGGGAYDRRAIQGA